jgi:hypothetical protein
MMRQDRILFWSAKSTPDRRNGIPCRDDQPSSIRRYTNSAIGAISRLLDIGILPDIMAGNIIGIVAQRLVRVLCNECKYPYTPDAQEQQLLGIAAHKDITLYRAAGCETCNHQGYKGRLAIMELLKLDYDLDDLISHRASARQIREAALTKGFRPLAWTAHHAGFSLAKLTGGDLTADWVDMALYSIAPSTRIKTTKASGCRQLVIWVAPEARGLDLIDVKKTSAKPIKRGKSNAG